ncbi:MAG: hypothetical protein COA95_03465 [Methylophaga sp.]|nr:MAG: hypothetical protein COA95_03465 [Methylophaga sp.]
MLTRFLFSFSILLFLTVANASGNIKLSIGQWSFEDIQAQNLQFDIKLTAKGLALTAKADSLILAKPIGQVTHFSLQCDELILLAETFSCGQGTVSFRQADLGQQKLSFKVKGEPEKSKYRIKLAGLTLASASFSATLYLDKKYWRLVTQTPKLQITEFIKVASPYLQEQQREALESWQVEGNINLSADIAGRNNEISTLMVDMATTSLNVTDSESRYVTENVILGLDFSAKNNKQNWQWQTELTVDRGQAYGEPIFVDFDVTPVSLFAKGLWQQTKGDLEISTAKFHQKGVVQVFADFKGSFEKVEQLNVQIEKSNIARLYENWLQPFVLGTAVDSLNLAGSAALNYHQSADNYHVSLDLQNVFIKDELNRFSVDEVNGSVGWTNYDHQMNSSLGWEKAIMYAVQIGQSQFQAQTVSSSLTLTQPWDIPVFDGKLKINKLNLHRPGEQGAEWFFDGRLTPISMEQVSEALGWPLLHGKLSGVIPKVSYSDKHIKVDGALTVKLFEGTTVITDLKLAQPFGSLPQLYANVDLKNMNLSTLSETFDFGDISGRLEGKIRDLRLANWRPVQFDAHFATPKNDKSRHRISQKAINNLSKVGGGVGAALQRSFLRFFEDFSYKRLGLSCKLHNEVCEMSGVGEAENGYYIVKGGGLPPRINVVGYTRQVDWSELIDRLKAVSNSSEPIVIE